MWTAVAGYPVAWHKLEGGAEVDWIGATISNDRQQVVVTIPEAKAQELAERTQAFLVATARRKQDLRSFCGSCSFVAELI